MTAVYFICDAFWRYREYLLSADVPVHASITATPTWSRRLPVHLTRHDVLAVTNAILRRQLRDTIYHQAVYWQPIRPFHWRVGNVDAWLCSSHVRIHWRVLCCQSPMMLSYSLYRGILIVIACTDVDALPYWNLNPTDSDCYLKRRITLCVRALTLYSTTCYSYCIALPTDIRRGDIHSILEDCSADDVLSYCRHYSC